MLGKPWGPGSAPASPLEGHGSHCCTAPQVALRIFPGSGGFVDAIAFWLLGMLRLRAKTINGQCAVAPIR